MAAGSAPQPSSSTASSLGHVHDIILEEIKTEKWNRPYQDIVLSSCNGYHAVSFSSAEIEIVEKRCRRAIHLRDLYHPGLEMVRTGQGEGYKALLQFLNDAEKDEKAILNVLDSPKSSETDIAVILAVHLFSKLAPNSSVILCNDVKKLKTFSKICPCGCDGKFKNGNTGIDYLPVMPRKRTWKKSAAKTAEHRQGRHEGAEQESPGNIQARSPGNVQARSPGNVQAMPNELLKEFAEKPCSNILPLPNELLKEFAEKSCSNVLHKVLVNEFHQLQTESSAGLASQSLVFGSYHQGNQFFSMRSRGRQCTCTSLMMLAYVQDQSTFTSNILDNILIEGDSLYISRIEDLQRNGQFKNYLLSFDELPSVIPAANGNYSIVKFDTLTGNVLESQVFHTYSLEKALKQSFQMTNTALLMVGALCSAVFKLDDVYYFYDSHSHDISGMSGMENGKAILGKFLTLESLLSYLYAFYESVNLLENTVFELQPVKFSTVHALGHEDKICDHLCTEYNAPKVDDLLTKYFKEQATMQDLKNKVTGKVIIESSVKETQKDNTVGHTICHSEASEKRKLYKREYMAKYMKLRRENTEQREFEKIKGKLGKQNARKKSEFKQKEANQKKAAKKDPEKGNFLKVQDKSRKKNARQDPEFKLKESKQKKAAREDPEKGESLREQEKSSKKNAREDPIKRQLEREREREGKKDAREDPEFKLKESKQKKAAREDPEKGESLKEQEKSSKKNAREDPEFKLKESKQKKAAREDPEKGESLGEQEKSSKKNARQDPEFKLKESKQKKAAREDPEKGESLREQEKSSKKNARQDPEFKLKESKQKKAAREDPEKGECLREKEKSSKKNAREDPIKRQLEREREREGKKDAREDPEFKLKESKQKKTAREDPEKGDCLREQEKSSKKNAREDPKFKLKESKQKKAAREDPEKGESLREQEKSGKKNARQDPEIKLKESKQKKAAREDPEKRECLREQEKNSKKDAREDPEFKLKESKQKKAAREDPEKGECLREQEKSSKKNAREDPIKRQLEREREREGKKDAREDPEFKLKESKQKKTAREDSEKGKSLREQEKESKKRKRKNDYFRTTEMVSKRYKRSFSAYRDQEKKTQQKGKSVKRQSLEGHEHETSLRKKRRHGSGIEHCIDLFLQTVSKGPVYVCTCCLQTWFSHSVSDVQQLKQKFTKVQTERYLRGYKSVDNTEWICRTCLSCIKQGKTPKLSVFNKMTFPVRPHELQLHQLEERLIALRIPFMQIRELPRGGQLSIKGNVVNVPVDIQPTVNALPRQFDTNVTVPVKLKKKLIYKKSDFTENVRPAAVISGLHWLMENSNLYKNSGIVIDKDWVAKLSETEESMKEFVPGEQQLSQNSSGTENDIPQGENHADGYDSDHYSEIDEQEKFAGSSDTLLDDANPCSNNTYTFAPGEGQQPLSLYQDPDAEYLAFPSIFCGQRRADNADRTLPVHYSDIVKWELRNVDRRVANNVPNIFFKMKKLQMKQVSDKVSLALRRCKTKGKKITAEQALNPETVNNIVRLDEGYYIFRTLRNSPPYLEAKKKEVFAMIRQLGLPTWFASFSSADTRWKDLLKMLVQLNDRKEISDEEVENLTWHQKTNLVQQDPVTCARYFDHRVQQFINTVLKSDHKPLGKLKDFFYRVEFQHRGSPHIHMLMWIEDAPKYNESSIDEVTDYIDKHVSCSSSVHESVGQFVDFQTHKHSKSCRKKGKAICRFGFPQPPMSKTMILDPLDDSENPNKYSKLYKEIQSKMNEEKDGLNISYEEFLRTIEVSEDDYIKAVRSSLDGPKVFVKREPCDIRVNPYMKNLIHAWQANHDLQFVLDAFACAVYIVSYISKAQRGMSLLLDQACKEAKQGNMDLRKQVRHMGNHFLNSVEICEQEAVYLDLQMALTKSSRGFKFINTAEEADRTFLMRSKASLEKLPKDSTDVEASNDVKRYAKRPKQLQNWCLADYCSQLEVEYPKEENLETVDWDNNDDDLQVSDDENEGLFAFNKMRITTKGGIVIRQKELGTILRYVRYSKSTDPENFYRERLMLFWPWREEKELKGGYDTYEEHYNGHRRFIEKKAQEYEKNVDALQKAMDMAVDQDLDYDQIAPGTEQMEKDDFEEGSRESEHFVYFNPDRAEAHKNYDIGYDIGFSAKHVNVDCQRLSTEQYLHLIRSLNCEQKEFFLHVLHWIKTKQEPLYAFLTGGAGVGKSVVVKAIYQALNRHLSTDAGENPEDCRVLICAPTGTAAYNVNGFTIDGALKLFDKGFVGGAESLNTLRMKYRNLSVLIIDEVSMVGNLKFKKINERLQQIKGSSKFFGGISVIVIGDLYQLRPVRDSWIFEPLKYDFGPLATNLWQELFVVHELTLIMRQKDDAEFAELLNRLRKGNHTEADIDKLKMRLTDSNNPECPKTAPHLYVTNHNVDAFNKKVFNCAVGEKVAIHSLDSVVGDLNWSVKKQLLETLPKRADDTAGLANLVEVAVGLIYDLTSNLDVADGLTNGTSCHIKCIDRRQENTTRPSVIWVLFDQESIGMERRQQYRYLYHDGIDKNWTPIFDIKRTFIWRKNSFIRIQFPLKLGAAKTVHKSQGHTLDAVVVDMTSNYSFPHIHYVAFSRVTSLKGLHILGLQENKICGDKKVDDEMDRMVKDSKLQLCFTPVYNVDADMLKVVFHNTRSLHCHIEDLRSERNLTAADVLCVSETWLQPVDPDNRYELQGFHMYRMDAKADLPNARPHRGLILYLKHSITMNQHHMFTSTHLEFIMASICTGDYELQVLAIYKSPQCSFQNFRSLLQHEALPFINSEESIVITGDFNCDILKEGKQYLQFMEQTFNCKQLISSPTHDSGSLLDHIYTNVADVNVDTVETVYSDHKIVYAALKM